MVSSVLLGWSSGESRGCPHLKIEMWGTRLRCGPPAAEFVHYSIKLAEFIIGGVALGGLNEAGKQLYLASSECVRTRLRRWTEERNAEARRDRIHFTLSEAGEMLVSMESKKTSE
jgi:hypothetical protein